MQPEENSDVKLDTARQGPWYTKPAVEIIGGCLVIIFAIVSVIALVRDLAKWNAIIIGVMLIFLLGVAFFLLKKNFLMFYGFFEIASAIVIGGYSIARATKFQSMSVGDLLSAPDSLSTILGLASSVYIVVRGVGNVADAGKKAEEKRKAEAEMKKSHGEVDPEGNP